jgi:hypothetical protein
LDVVGIAIRVSVAVRPAYDLLEDGSHDVFFPMWINHRPPWAPSSGRAQALEDSEQHVVPGHDPLVRARYPAPSPELEGIVVRLDVAPADC